MSTNKMTYLIYDFYSSGYASFFPNAFYGHGPGPIWLDDLHCSGYELTLVQCSHSQFARHNCDHNDDVSVRCSGSKTGSLFKLKIFSDLF